MRIWKSKNPKSLENKGFQQTFPQAVEKFILFFNTEKISIFIGNFI